MIEKTNTLCKKIALASLRAVDPFSLVVGHVRRARERLYIKDKEFDLARFKNIHVLGAGKGAPFLYQGLREVLAERIAGGIIVSLKSHAFSDKKVKFYYGSHPLPDEKSLDAGRAVVDYIKTRLGKDDLVFFLVTGGASAMMVYPAAGVAFRDKVAVNRLLLSCGANISEINCVRKHLSLLKGGGLAKLVYPAALISLILSDIVDSPLEDIGSGPSIGDATSSADAYRILEKYHLVSRLPPGIAAYFKKGIKGEIADTPLPRSKIFRRHHPFLLGENLTALTTAKAMAEQEGFQTHILSSRDRGEAREAAKVYAAIMKEIACSGQPYKPPLLLLAGGELTVTLKGKGKGGRNQEFVLAMLKELQGLKQPFYVLSIGSDGIDGPTDAAGAWIDAQTIAKVKRLNLDIDRYLENNDSYRFFRKIDQLVKTGPTRTNVADLRMFYIGSRDPA